MPLALNTSHPLYANLVSLIAVDDDNVIKELVGTATMTPHADVTIGSGTYGRHFQTSIVSNNARGVQRDAVVPAGTTGAPNCSVFIAANDFLQASAVSRNALLTNNSTPSSSMPVPAVNSSGQVAISSGTVTPSTYTTGNVATGAHSICVTRTGQTAHQVMFDGDAEVISGGQIGVNGTTNGWNYIGGHSSGGFGGCPAQFVYIATFNKVLTSTESKDLHDSLTGSNAFGLVTSSGGGGGSTLPLKLQLLTGA